MPETTAAEQKLLNEHYELTQKFNSVTRDLSRLGIETVVRSLDTSVIGVGVAPTTSILVSHLASLHTEF